MTVYCLSENRVKARKAHKCDACQTWLRSGYGEPDVSPKEWAIVVACEADNWTIPAGSTYLRAVFNDGGALVTAKARLDMDALCSKLDLYEN